MEIIERQQAYHVKASSFIKPDIGFHTQFIHNNPNGFHMHDFYEMIYIVSGKITHSIGGEQRSLETGNFVLVPVGTEHGFFPPKECYNRDLLISTELFDAVCTLLPSAKEGMDALAGKILKLSLNDIYKFEKLLNDYQEETEVPLKRCKAIKLLIDIFSVLLYTAPADEKNIPTSITSRIVSTINKNFNLPNCLDVVKNFNYSNSYLRKIFKKNIGCTMSDYLKKVRLSHVEYYLKTTDYSLRQIADLVGIESLSYLNKIFKEEYSVSPIKYRNNLGKETTEE